MSILYNLSSKNDSPTVDTYSFYTEIEAARHEWRESCVNDTQDTAGHSHRADGQGESTRPEVASDALGAD